MRKTMLILVIVAAAIILASCEKMESDNPMTINLDGTAKMRIAMHVNPELGIHSGDVTISKGDMVYSQPLEFDNGNASVLFSDLQPGIWLVEVELRDEDDYVLYQGSGEAGVVGGQTNTATIVLEELSGDLEVIIELPLDGAEGLVAYYSFNGNANDETGNGSNGIVYGATLTNDRFGNPESAYEFDGQDDWVKVENNEHININGYHSLSVCAWVKCPDYAVLSLYAGVVTKWGPGSQMDDQYILHFRSGILAWGLGEEEDFLHYDTTENTEWMFLAGVYDVAGESLQLYVDGVLVETGDLYYPIRDTDRYLEIGGHSNHWHFTGAIDDVSIYDRALTAGEVQDLFETPISIVADYHFDTSIGSVATDSSGNNNDGTLIGFTDYTFGYADDPANPGYTSDGKIRLVRDGPIEYIETPIVASTFFTNSFTIEAVTGLHPDPWFWQPLVGYVIDGEAFVYWGAGYSTGSLAPPHWHIDNGGPWESYSAFETVLTDGTMHHYAMTYDAVSAQLLMYLDYELIATVNADLSNVVPAGDSGLVLIGSHTGIASYEVWHGLIDRIRFSDEVVDPEDFIHNP